MIMSNDLWFQNDVIREEASHRKKAEQTEAQLEALTQRTKPEANKWLHLTPRFGALGADAFQRGPPMIAKIHQYFLESLDRAERRGDKATEFIDRMNRKTLEIIRTENVQERDGQVRTDSVLKDWEQVGPGSFLAKLYPKLFQYMIKEFIGATTKWSMLVILALFELKIAKGTCSITHRGHTESTPGWSLDCDCDDVRHVGRVHYPNEVP